MKRIIILLAILMISLVSLSYAATLTVPSSVEVIEAEAFYGDTGIDEVILPAGIKSIEEKAFANSGIKKINLPGNIEFIADDAFADSSLEDVIVSKPSYAYNWAVRNGYIFENATPAEVFSYQYSSDGKCCISGYLGTDEDIVIPRKNPEGVTISGITRDAFSQCGYLKSISIPDYFVPDSEFVTGGATIYARAGSETAKKISRFNSFSPFGEKYSLRYIYAGNEITGLKVVKADKDITTIIIPDGVTGIDKNAFYGCTYLTSVYIPEGVEEIGDYAFYQCNNLSDINIPDSVTSINANCFSSCTGLAEITIPSGVTYIGENAFHQNTKLFSQKNTSGAKALGKAGYSFREPDKQYNLKYLFSGSEETGLAISNIDKDILSIDIPTDVTVIGKSAFSGCVNLTELTIPDLVETIEDNAFYECTNLRNIVLPPNLVSIAYQAFYNCSSLSEIMIPNSVTSINSSAFTNCNAQLFANIDTEGAKSISRASYYFRIPGANYDLQYRFTNGEVTGAYLCNVDEYAESLYIPDYVTAVSIVNASVLNSIIVDPANVVYSSADGVLYDINKTTLIKCPARKAGALVIPQSVQKIVATAFDESVLSRIEVPANCVIEGAAFEHITDYCVIEIKGDSFTLAGWQGALGGFYYDPLIGPSSGYLGGYLKGLIMPGSYTIEPYSESLYGYYGEFSGAVNRNVEILRITDNSTMLNLAKLISKYRFIQDLYIPASVESIELQNNQQNKITRVHCVKGSYAWDFFRNLYGSSDNTHVVEWNGITDPLESNGGGDIYQNDAMLSGHIIAASSGENVPGIDIYVYNLANERIGYTFTGKDGTWAVGGLNEQEYYKLYYGNSDFTVSENGLVVKAGNHIESTASLYGEVSDSITFTMQQDDRILNSGDSMVVGTSISFTVHASNARKIRFVADGIPYEEYIVENDEVTFQRTISLGGERTISFQAMPDDSYEYSICSNTKTLNVTNENGTLEIQSLAKPEVSAVRGQLVNQPFTVSWNDIVGAEGFNLYIYDQNGGCIWYRELESTQTTEIVTIDEDGLFSVSVIAYGRGYNQSEGGTNVLVKDTEEALSVINAAEISKSVLGGSCFVTVSSCFDDLFYRLYIEAPDGVATYTASTKQKEIYLQFDMVGTYRVQAIASDVEEFDLQSKLYACDAFQIEVDTNPRILSIKPKGSGFLTISPIANDSQSFALLVKNSFIADQVKVFENGKLLCEGKRSSTGNYWYEFECSIPAQTVGKHLLKVDSYYQKQLINTDYYTFYTVHALNDNTTWYNSANDILKALPENENGIMIPAGSALQLLGEYQNLHYVKWQKTYGFIISNLVDSWENSEEIVIEPELNGLADVSVEINVPDGGRWIIGHPYTATVTVSPSDAIIYDYGWFILDEEKNQYVGDETVSGLSIQTATPTSCTFIPLEEGYVRIAYGCEIGDLENKNRIELKSTVEISADRPEYEQYQDVSVDVYYSLLNVLESSKTDAWTHQSIRDTVRVELLHAFDNDAARVEKLMKRLDDAPKKYRDLYLWSFFDYVRNPEPTSISNHLEARVQISSKSYADDTVWFHEAGHAIDYCLTKTDYYTVGDIKDDIFDSIYTSIYQKVSDTAKFYNSFGDIFTVNDEELQEVIDWIVSPEFSYVMIGPESWELYYPTPPSGSEATIAQIQLMRDVMTHWYWLGLRANNADMLTDAFAGITNGTMMTGNGHGLSVSADQKYYWYDEDNEKTYMQNKEAWAEYFSSQITGSRKSDNVGYFAETCRIFDIMADNLLTLYRQKHR